VCLCAVCVNSNGQQCGEDLHLTVIVLLHCERFLLSDRPRLAPLGYEDGFGDEVCEGRPFGHRRREVKRGGTEGGLYGTGKGCGAVRELVCLSLPLPLSLHFTSSPPFLLHSMSQSRSPAYA
jgi:hypothetical protein